MVVRQYVKQILAMLGCAPFLVYAQLPVWGDYPALPKQAENTLTSEENPSDPYRFLESLSDPQVRAWMKKQTDFANAALVRISGRDALLKRLRQLHAAEFGTGNLIEVRGMQFYVSVGADSRSRLFMRNAATGAERILLLTDVGQSVNFFTPSLDASYVAVHIIRTEVPGRQRHSLRLIKTSDASMLKENVDSIASDAKEIGWKPDSTALYYRRAPAKPGADKGAIWQHVLDTKIDMDVPVIGPNVSKGRRFTANDVLTVKTSANSAYLLVEVQHGISPDKSWYIIKQDQLKAAASPWVRLASPADKLRNAWLSGEQLYFLSAKKKATGAISRLNLKALQLSSAQELVPASTDELLDLAVAKNGLYIHATEGGFSKLIKAELNGDKQQVVTLPYIGRISQLNADPDSEGALFVLEAPNVAPLSYRALAGGQVKNVEVYKSPQVGFHKISTRNLTISKPGSHQQLALTLIYPQGMELDGKHPCLLSVEAGSGLAKLTKFDPLRLAWLEQDAMMAILYLPETNGQKKPMMNDGADELLVAADYLISEGYTSPRKLLLQETAAGKKVIAQVINRRPELFAAVQSAAILSEILPSKTKKSNLKDKKNEGVGSPYQSLKEGQAYPSSLFTARFGVGDAPIWMSGKFAARLQAININKARPAFFRTDFAYPWKWDALEEMANNWAFLLWQAGQKGFTVQP